MPGHITTETFFRPAERWREALNIPAELFNRCRLLLTRCKSEQLFIPIRSMQYQAVIDREEIIYVDNHGGYAVQDGEGGRLIVFAWELPSSAERDSLTEPVPVTLIAYDPETREIHRRLMSELPRALDRAEEKQRESGCEPKRKNVLAFRPTDS